MKTPWAPIAEAEFSSADKNTRKLASFLTKMDTGLRRLFDNGLLWKDNHRIALVERSFVHGAPTPIKNPFGRGVRPWGVIGAWSDGLPIDGVPSLVMQNTLDGVLTVRFQPPFGFVHVRRDANQATTTGADAQVEFDAHDQVAGESLVHDVSSNPSRITCVEPGIVKVCGSAVWESAATGRRLSFVSKNGVRTGDMSRYGYAEGSPDATAARCANAFSTEITVNAGDYLELDMTQTSGGNLNIRGADSSGQTYLQARYIEPPVGYSAKIHLAILGG